MLRYYLLSIRIIIALGIATLPAVGYAAELSFSPASGSYSVGQEFSVRVLVSPTSGESINAADGELTFDASVLSISSVSKDGSSFSLWTADPSFSNAAGTATFSGGTPTAFSAQGTVMTIKFKAKAVGTATLNFSKGSILAADGKGTDVYTKGNPASLTITEAAPKLEAPAPKETPPPVSNNVISDEEYSIVPIAPVLTSSTHSKPDVWYGTSTVIFSWKPPADVEKARVVLSQNPEDEPKEELEGEITSHTTYGVADGVWHFRAQFKNEFGWGAVGTRELKIDTVPPEEFELSLVSADGASGIPRFKFETTDALSGVDHYDLKMGDGPIITVKPIDLVGGEYAVPVQAGGVMTVVVTAYDKAGNPREAKAMLDVPEVLKPEDTAGQNNTSPWGIERFLLILFALTTGGLGALYFHSRKIQQQEVSRVLQSVVEVREMNDRVFSAMREEFEELVNEFDVKPQLTPEERDLLESIKEVLEISEGLLDSAIEDVKKLVRGQQ